MIAGGENFFSWNFKKTRQLGQRRTLVIIRVAKAEINGVALIIELRLPGPRLIDELGDAIQLVLACGDQTLEAFRLINQSRFGLLADEVDDFGEHRLR